MRPLLVSALVLVVACGSKPEPAAPLPPPPPPAPPPPVVAPAPPVAPAPAPAAMTATDKLLKVDAKGVRDPGWGTNGVANISVHPSLVSADGKGGVYVFEQRTATGAAGTNRIVAVHLGVNGAHDPGFGTNGEQELGAPGTSLLQGVTLDGKGRVVLLVSQKAANAKDTTIIAYRFANGRLDASFNGGGASTVTIPTPAVTARTGPVAIGADAAGRVVIAGTDDPAKHRQVFVVRLTENGSIDPSFARGVAVSSASNLAVDVARVTVDSSNGNVVVVANKSVQGGTLAAPEPVPASGGIALFRFDPNGMVDTKFGKQGAVVLEDQSCAALDAWAADGAIIVGGYTGGTAATMKPVLLRWNNSGAPDSGFGSGGKLVLGGVEGATLGRIRRVTRDGTGRIVAVGSYRTAQDSPVTFVTRLDATGKPDPSYGTAGTTSFNVQALEPEVDPQGNAFFRSP